MAEFVSCPSCKARLKVPDDMVGQDRVVKCPKCAHPISLAELGTTAKPSAKAQRPAAAAPEVDEDEARERPRKAARERREDEEDEERPRARKKRARDDEEDEDDERPARRKARKAKKKSGGNLGLIIGLAVGGGVLLLACCGVGGYFLFSGRLGGIVDNPAVTQANFDKVQMEMALQGVEDIFGRGGDANGADVKALLAPAGGARMGAEDQIQAVADNPQAYGITGWYRWKNGPTTMVVAVDGAKKVRVAGLVTIAPNSRSSSWKSSLQLGGAPGGAPPPPPRGGRGR